MTERKFTDEEVIKALECCIAEGCPDCDECPFEECCCDGTNKMLNNALDFINRQRAEHEKVVINMNAYGLAAKRLQEDVERLQEINNRQVEDIRLAKAEAIKEFAESMKKRERSNAYCCFCAHATVYGGRAKECDEPYIDKDGKEHSHCLMFSKFESYIDKLVKEMTEGKQ